MKLQSRPPVEIKSALSIDADKIKDMIEQCIMYKSSEDNERYAEGVMYALKKLGLIYDFCATNYLHSRILEIRYLETLHDDVIEINISF